jgi:hypothetical protein
MYKIKWSHHTEEEEATWETEQFLNAKYPDFLPSQARKWTFLTYSWFESRDEIPIKGGRL